MQCEWTQVLGGGAHSLWMPRSDCYALGEQSYVWIFRLVGRGGISLPCPGPAALYATRF